jgi:hypothetical protein
MREVPRTAFASARTARPEAPAAIPVILFTAGGMRFAVDAGEVKEIRDGEERASLERMSGAEPIDFAQLVGLGSGRVLRYVVLKPGDCSLGVSDVERMASPPKVAALPGLFRGAEREWYRGLLLLGDEVVPLVRTEHWRQRARESGEGGHGTV